MNSLSPQDLVLGRDGNPSATGSWPQEYEEYEEATEPLGRGRFGPAEPDDTMVWTMQVLPTWGCQTRGHRQGAHRPYKSIASVGHTLALHLWGA